MKRTKTKWFIFATCVLIACSSIALLTSHNAPPPLIVEKIPASEVDGIVRAARKWERGCEMDFLWQLIKTMHFQCAAEHAWHYHQATLHKIELQEPNMIVVTFSRGTNMDWSHLFYRKEKSGLSPSGGVMGD